MASLLNIIFSLAFAGAVGGAFHLWRVHLDTARRDGMQALAARRGWALTVTGERLGRTGTMRLVPRGGNPWIAEARPSDGRPGRPVTEYEAEEPRWADGTLILIATGATASEVRPVELDGERSPSPPATRNLSGLLGDEMARLASQLAPVAAPEGVVALAQGDLARRVDLGDLAKALNGFQPVASGARGQPVLILSPEGMRLRLRHAIKRPDQMERFLDLAFELSRLIGP
jgi:hypothetical protein